MSARAFKTSRQPASARREREFTETGFWAGLNGAWKPLHGGVRERGYSIEWHDFTTDREFDWAPSFHPGALEICLNLAGRGRVEKGSQRLDLAPLSAGFYFQGNPPLSGCRAAGERHQFLTVELVPEFLRQHLDGVEGTLAASVRAFLGGARDAQLSPIIPLGTEHQLLIASLRKPPVHVEAQRLWYHAKALEVASALLFCSPARDDLFCERQKRLNRERVQKVVAVLRENLAESLSLEEIGRRVGCSHFHLSRIFSQETGHSIFQYLRQLRLERAAELLREGRLTVTQVALDVGYSSPSHFSTAFHEAYGCCPGLYPLATLTQRMRG